jgi:tetratricopeptide (TPR) repeat protein
LDEAVYHRWASQIANGTYQSSSPYQFAPLPAYVMALVYKMWSPNLLYVRILNILFGVATCYFVYLIGREMADRRIGLVACLVAALYKPFIFYSIVPLNTSLSIVLFAASTYFFLTVLRTPSFMNTLLTGVVIGLLLNVRPNAIVLIPLMPVMILWSQYRAQPPVQRVAMTLMIYALGVGLAAAPFALRNYRVSGEFVLTTSHSGYNLYLGNNLDNPDPYYRPVPFASSNPYEQGVQFAIEASRRTARTLSPGEASSYWTRQVAKTAFAQPAAFMWKIWQKTLVLVNRFEAGDHYDIDFMSQFAGFFRFPFLTLAVILPLGMAGMATTVWKSKPALGGSALFLAYAATLVLFFTNDRYRLPLLVLLIPFAVLGIGHLRSSIKQRRFGTIGIYSVIVILFLVVEHLPVQATDDVTAYYNTHARLLDQKGSEKEAMAYWETSSSMNKPFSAFADLGLAYKYFSKKDFTRAGSYLEKIPDSSFAAALKYELMGDLLFAQGQVPEAVAAYERSLAINSGRTKPRTKLVKIFEGIDKDKAQRENDALRYISSFYKGL